ncbi:MAG: septum formation initiator family protein [Eubacteriales bacterium]|nr:septum formation initiator family protein [Eubacteriales bacterium]MDD3881161.1 septum formation initiator family protein [Eubacteriales bacterium]MDD4511543.1 septum formation initiator family protein [Eubacteriales bacterium]
MSFSRTTAGISKRWLFVAAAAMILLYFIMNSVIAGRQAAKEEELRLARLELSDVTTLNKELQDKVNSASDSDYIESLARTKYGYMKRGETRYVISNPESFSETPATQDIEGAE